MTVLIFSRPFLSSFGSPSDFDGLAEWLTIEAAFLSMPNVSELSNLASGVQFTFPWVSLLCPYGVFMVF